MSNNQSLKASSPLSLRYVRILQVSNVLIFIIAAVLNALSSLPSRPFGATNADISNLRKTAFTPAGYAFSIWGVIYTLVSILLIHQARDRQFAENILSGYFIWNMIGNGLWIVTFTTQLWNLWASTVIIFAGILAPLLVIHQKMVAAKQPRQSWLLLLSEAAISVYAGWVSVACIANVSLTLLPYNLGNDAIYSIVMMTVGSILAFIFLWRFLDFTFAAPISWALIAISQQQRSSDYPGGPTTVLAALILGVIVAVPTIAVAGIRCYQIWQSRNLKNDDSDLEKLAANNKEGFLSANDWVKSPLPILLSPSAVPTPQLSSEVKL
jgi:TspO/MBR family